MNNYHPYKSVSRSFLSFIALISLSLISLQPVVAQDTDGDSTKEQTMEGKSQNARSAAPHSIAREAVSWDSLIVAPASANKVCFGGTDVSWANVEMCNEQNRQCVEFCVTKGAWEKRSGREIVRRFIFAVSEGAASLRKIRKATKDEWRGWRVGVKLSDFGVTMETQECNLNQIPLCPPY